MDSDTRHLEKHFGVFTCHTKVFYYDKASLYLFDHKLRVRRAIVWLVEWSYFKFFILLTVIVNSIMLATHSYEYRVNSSHLKETRLEETASKVFISIFFIEFILKVVAMGFIIKKYSYMRSPWNILDLICLISGILEQSINMDGLMMLRMLRVLKPLRSIKALPALQLLVQSLFASFAGLLNIYLFLGFVLSFGAVLGVNLFGGFQYRMCRTTPELIYDASGEAVWPRADINYLCSSDEACQSF